MYVHSVFEMNLPWIVQYPMECDTYMYLTTMELGVHKEKLILYRIPCLTVNKPKQGILYSELAAA